MSASTNDQETANPHVVGKQRQLSGVINRDVRIRRHRVHVLGHDDRDGATKGEVHGQLGMPGVGHELIQTIVTIAGREQQGVALLTFEDLLDGVTDTKVGPVHVASHDEHHGNRHVVVSDVAHPKAAGDGVQTTFESQEVAVGSPVTGEEGTNAFFDAGIELTNEVLIEKGVGQGDVCHRGNGLAIQTQGLAGVDGIHQRRGGQGDVNQVTSPGQ